MKQIILGLLMILGLVGCGNDNYYTKEVSVDKEVVVAQDFENVYFFENSGFIELVTSSDNQVSILREGYSLTSTNPKNGTLGMHPIVTRENLEPHNGKIVFSLNVNYGTSSQYDLEEDVSGSNIIGSHRTDFIYELLEDRNIKLTIKIYDSTINNNVNYLVATRVFTSI